MDELGVICTQGKVKFSTSCMDLTESDGGFKSSAAAACDLTSTCQRFPTFTAKDWIPTPPNTYSPLTVWASWFPS